MNTSTIEKGQDAEKLASEHLEKQGLTLIERNFRCPRGEIDIIMEQGKTIVFVEVRYRKHTQFGTGAETVTKNKQSKLIMTAMYYLQKKPQYSNRPSRFDVVSITPELHGPHIDWITDAFQN